MRNLLHHRVRFPGNLIVRLIALYQRTLSPDHGPLRSLFPYGYCRHSPTCSQYAKEQILKRGIFLGGLRALLRLCTCVPGKKPSVKRMMEASHPSL